MQDLFNILPVTAAFITGNDLYFIILIIAALGLGLYINLSAKNKKDSRADILLKKYKTIDRAALDHIPDAELVEAVIANLMAKLDPQKPDDYSLIPLLSRGRCAVYSIWLTCNELSSNGLAGILSGKSGRFAALSADGFELVGAQQTGKAIREILDTAQENQNLTTLEEKLKSAILQEKPLELCREYIRENPEEFLDN